MLKLAQIAKTNQRVQKTNLKISLDQIAVFSKDFQQRQLLSVIPNLASGRQHWLKNQIGNDTKQFRSKLKIFKSVILNHAAVCQRKTKRDKELPFTILCCGSSRLNRHKMKTNCGLWTESNTRKLLADSKWINTKMSTKLRIQVLNQHKEKKGKLYKITIAESKVGLKRRKLVDCGRRSTQMKTRRNLIAVDREDRHGTKEQSGLGFESTQKSWSGILFWKELNTQKLLWTPEGNQHKVEHENC